MNSSAIGGNCTITPYPHGNRIEASPVTTRAAGQRNRDTTDDQVTSLSTGPSSDGTLNGSDFFDNESTVNHVRQRHQGIDRSPGIKSTVGQPGESAHPRQRSGTCHQVDRRAYEGNRVRTYSDSEVTAKRKISDESTTSFSAQLLRYVETPATSPRSTQSASKKNPSVSHTSIAMPPAADDLHSTPWWGQRFINFAHGFMRAEGNSPAGRFVNREIKHVVPFRLLTVGTFIFLRNEVVKAIDQLNLDPATLAEITVCTNLSALAVFAGCVVRRARMGQSTSRGEIAGLALGAMSAASLAHAGQFGVSPNLGAAAIGSAVYVLSRDAAQIWLALGSNLNQSRRPPWSMPLINGLEYGTLQFALAWMSASSHLKNQEAHIASIALLTSLLEACDTALGAHILKETENLPENGKRDRLKLQMAFRKATPSVVDAAVLAGSTRLIFILNAQTLSELAAKACSDRDPEFRDLVRSVVLGTVMALEYIPFIFVQERKEGSARSISRDVEAGRTTSQILGEGDSVSHRSSSSMGLPDSEFESDAASPEPRFTPGIPNQRTRASSFPGMSLALNHNG